VALHISVTVAPSARMVVIFRKILARRLGTSLGPKSSATSYGREVGSKFTCEGVSSLADFSARVNEAESLDPVARAIRSSREPNSVSQFYRKFEIVHTQRS
jgi:hypothetical protein